MRLLLLRVKMEKFAILLLFLTLSNGAPSDKLERSGACPDPASIYPCQCTPNPTDLNGKPGMYCSGLETTQQAEQIFSSSSRTGGYSYIILANLFADEITKDFFGYTTAEVLSIRSSNLIKIDSNVFQYFKDSLTIISIENCKNLETFPFAALEGFNRLTMLELSGVSLKKFDGMPSLPALNQLVIESSGTLKSIQVLPYLPKLVRVTIHGLKLSVPPMAFHDLPALSFLDLAGNQIYRLRSNALKFTSPSVSTIRLQESPLDFMEVGAIQGINADTNIDISGSVRYLQEFAWRPILEEMAKSTGTLTVTSFTLQSGLVCDCHLAWLIRNQLLLLHVQNGICDNDGSTFGGLPLTDIPPEGLDYCP